MDGMFTESIRITVIVAHYASLIYNRKKNITANSNKLI